MQKEQYLLSAEFGVGEDNYSLRDLEGYLGIREQNYLLHHRTTKNLYQKLNQSRFYQNIWF